ncbi:helix-turn-helix domain-containing protein [Nonomuraea polychroma]|uniref:helix-turn-helix domain-containing protein n=1 Tax=Nonomuraea polychroma TaxID=46176 RepID=UPI003D910149
MRRDIAADALELLARDRGRDELAALCVNARRDGVDERYVRQVADLAEMVIERQEHRRSREAELNALVQSAIDLTALGDLEGIVSRTRLLLRADVTYLSLVDDSDDADLRVTNGATSSEFTSLRMKIGDSIGGLALRMGAPVVTRDYATDDRIAHLPHIDFAVEAEGLHSILAVPLMTRGAPRGVLYVAHRSERIFTTDDIAVASSLGSHAAVACENARLFDRTTAALHELKEAHATVEEQNAAIALVADTHRALTELVVDGASPAALAQTLSDVLDGASLRVLDAEGQVVAEAGPAVGVVPPTTLNRALDSARDSRRAVSVGRRHFAVVSTPAREYGAIVVESDRALDEFGLRILEQAALVMAVLVMMRTIVSETEDRLRRDLVDDLLSESSFDNDTLAARASRLGMDLHQPQVVVVASSDEAVDLSASSARWVSASPWRHCLVGKHAGRQVFILEGAAAGDAARMVAEELGRWARCTVTAGAAGPVSGLSELRTAFDEASGCLDTLVRMGGAGRGAAAIDLGLAGLVLAERPDPSDFIASTIGPVLDYDEKRGSQLLKSLHAYLDSDRNVSLAARRLNVHANTLRQRLDRMTQLLGQDWQTRRRLLDIEVALQLRYTMHQFAS